MIILIFIYDLASHGFDYMFIYSFH